jgi:hypothetical protein
MIDVHLKTPDGEYHYRLPLWRAAIAIVLTEIRYIFRLR